jgi:hypothetical protein
MVRIRSKPVMAKTVSGVCSPTRTINSWPADCSRVLTVLKTRASGHEPESREYTISPEGIVLGPATGADAAL